MKARRLRLLFSAYILSLQKVRYTYTSDKYYEVRSERVDLGWHFSLSEKEFSVPFTKGIEEEIFEPYKEGSEVYLAEMNGEEAAIMVIQKMEWNNTVLIHDLYVDFRYKNKRIGRTLIEIAKKRAMACRKNH